MENVIERKKEDFTWIIVLMKDILYNSLAQAIVKLFKKSHFSLKLILLLFILSSISLASFMVISTIIDYYSYDVITNSRVIYETPTLFPKITICNQNKFITQYAYEFVEAFNSSWNIFRKQNSSFKETHKARIDFYNLVLGSTFKSNFGDSNRQNLGHNFEDILMSCYFNNEICNASDFKWKFDPLYGNCYEFNSNANSAKYSVIPGWINGLMLELYVNFNENLKEFNSVYGGVGAVVRLDNSSYLLDHGWNGIQLPAGFTSFIAIERSFKSLLPKPYSDCNIGPDELKNLDSELYKLIAKSNFIYTQMLCFEQCYQREVAQECGSVDSNFLSLYPQNPVDSNEAYECVNRVYSNKYLSSDFLNSVCLPLCPLECNSTEYKASFTMSQLIGDIYADYIKNNRNLSSDFIQRSLNSETAARSFVKLNIFYDSLSYTLVTETPKMNVVSMLASIGGNMGLFLGVSVFSICEVVELIIRIVLKKHD